MRSATGCRPGAGGSPARPVPGCPPPERKARLGWRLTRPSDAEPFQLDVETSRCKAPGGGPADGIGLRLTSRLGPRIPSRTGDRARGTADLRERTVRLEGLLLAFARMEGT